MLEFLTGFQDIALLFARIFLGAMFIVHGKGKMLGPEPGVKGFSEYLKQLGFPLPIVFAFIAAAVEFWGGIAIILGIFTKLVASLMAILILVATFVNIDKGKQFKGGWEFDLMILTICILLMTFGPGAYSIAAFIGL